MKYFVAYLLISFVAIGVLGFVGLTSHESLFSQCVNATIPGGMPCSDVPHNFQMNVLHANIFQSFTFATLALAFMLFAAYQFLAILMKETLFYSFEFSLNEVKTTTRWYKIHRWLKLNQQHPGHA